MGLVLKWPPTPCNRDASSEDGQATTSQALSHHTGCCSSTAQLISSMTVHVQILSPPSMLWQGCLLLQDLMISCMPLARLCTNGLDHIRKPLRTVCTLAQMALTCRSPPK